MEKQQKRVFNVGTRSFIAALIILFLLMVLTYALTLILPAGEYARVITDGKETIIPGTYQSVTGGLSFVKWLLSPFLALGAAGAGTVIAIIAFLLVIGGAFNAMDECGVLSYMFNRVYRKFERQKYRLLLLVTLFLWVWVRLSARLRSACRSCRLRWRLPIRWDGMRWSASA